MDTIVSIFFSLLGATGILGIATRSTIKRLKTQENRQSAIELGVQALLRDRMLHNYTKYTELGYAPIFAKENFENMYQQYHGLGGNGVMTHLHSDFMSLPSEPTEEVQ